VRAKPKKGPDRSCIDRLTAGECALKTEAIGRQKQVLDGATQGHKFFRGSDTTRAFFRVKTGNRDQKDRRIVCFGRRLSTLQFSRQSIPRAQGLSKGTTQGLTAFQANAYEAPRQQLAMIGRGGCRKQHALQLCVIGSWGE